VYFINCTLSILKIQIVVGNDKLMLCKISISGFLDFVHRLIFQTDEKYFGNYMSFGPQVKMVEGNLLSWVLSMGIESDSETLCSVQNMQMMDDPGT
jgi:hypothetical protein